MGDHEKTLKIEYDDIRMKTKLILTRFGSTFGRLRFDERSSFKILLGFTPFRDYTPTIAIHADSAGVYISDEILKLSTINKTHLKCDVIDGSFQNGLEQPILYSFVLVEKPGYKIFSERETIHYKKIIKSNLNTTAFYLEDDNNEEINRNRETFTFTLQIIKT